MPFCINCGQENPDVAKFCLACGTAIATAPAAAPVETRTEERRLVTAVFTDIVGSTATAEQLDPEDVRARLAPYYAEARRELELHGGSVAKFIGDAVVALFGAPIAHEDDPERAVRAAFAVTRAIEKLNASDDWLDLNIRTGVNTGDAIVVVGSNPGEEIGEAAGDVMNTAARIQGAAPINGVVVGELTYEATKHAIEYEEGAPVEAKGKAEPVRVWIAKEAKDVPTRRESRQGTLVGRDAELEKLLGLWEQVQSDRLPGRATVVGSPGIGKSRLLEEVGARVDEDGKTVWGRCLPYGEGITYWAVTEILKGAAGILQSEGPEQISVKLGALLESVGEDNLDELRTMAAAASNILGVATTPRGTYSATEITQAELHWGIRRVLQLLARKQPLMVVFEDLHWAEPTLIELVRYIAEDEPDAPILVVGSARPELAESMPALMRERERQVAIELEPLGAEVGRALLGELLSEEALKDTGAVDSLLKNAGGNPLFLEETVRMLMDRGVVDESGWHREEGAALPIPNSLQSLIGSRLDQLIPPERRVAQHASVVGSVFWPGAVAHLQKEGGGAHDVELEQRLEVLERRDLIREHDDSSVAGEREYAFKHILIRDVAYGRMPRGRRAQLHLRFADWTEGLSEAADEFIEIIAYHLEQACQLTRAIARPTIDPPVDRAVHALSRAGEKAEAHEGMREADRFYARALDLVGDETAATELRLRRANVMLVLGQAQAALELLREIVEEARAENRLDLACEAIGFLASIDHRQGRGALALERFEESLKLAGQVGNRKLQVRAAYALASAKGDLGAADEALEELRRAISIAEEIEDRPLRVVGHLRAGFLLFNKGDLAGAEEQLERCSSLAAELGSHRDEARATFLLALIKYYRGSRDEAEQLGEQARAWLERTGETFFQIQNLVALAQYALARDDLQRAEQTLRAALPVALEEGALEAMDIYRLLIETLIRQGRLSDANELAEFAGRDVVEENEYALAALRLAEAAVATAERDAAVAVAHYEQAIALLDQLELEIEVSQARLTFGRALRELGDAEHAREQLELALRAWVGMGATGLVSDVERELALVGAPGS
jgi:class 3 adenylate cyclase/tetratricopeptide (TPR) repeat protein